MTVIEFHQRHGEHYIWSRLFNLRVSWISCLYSGYIDHSIQLVFLYFDTRRADTILGRDLFVTAMTPNDILRSRLVLRVHGHRCSETRAWQISLSVIIAAMDLTSQDWAGEIVPNFNRGWQLMSLFSVSSALGGMFAPLVLKSV